MQRIFDDGGADLSGSNEAYLGVCLSVSTLCDRDRGEASSLSSSSVEEAASSRRRLAMSICGELADVPAAVFRR